MSPIKVLHVTSVDKGNYYLNNLVDFSPAGSVDYSFVTFAAECDFTREMKKRGRAAHALNCMSRRKYPQVYRKLGSIIETEAPDIVHTHLFDPSLIGLTVAKRLGKKTVMTRHHSDAVHVIDSPAKRRFYLALENYISGKADHIIAPSQMVRDILVKKEGVSADKVTVIPYGQTTERFDAVTPEKISAVKAELGMGQNLSLVNVSRLFHRKGHQFLFAALAKLRVGGIDATLYLVGDGEYRAALEELCRNLGIAKHVWFLGWRDDALALIAAADIIVHPSLEDALSSAVIEAVMLGKPVIATDISGVRDSLGDGKYGVIVAPADASDLERGIKSVLKDIGSAKDTAREGRKYLLDYMDAGRVSKEHSRLYQDLLKK